MRLGLLIILLAPLIPRLRAAAPEGMVLIAAGEFIMGSEDGAPDERPRRRVRLSAFYMDRREVSNADFAQFVRAGERPEAVEGPWFRYYARGAADLIGLYEERYGDPLQGLALEGLGSSRPEDLFRWRAAAAALREMLRGAADYRARERIASLAARPAVRALFRRQARYPVRGVSWRDAAAYCRWAGKRLPTEAQWEKAARGKDGRAYPWGSTWDSSKGRLGLAAGAGPAAVGSYPRGASPYGCDDMAGNVWEWVADWYGEDAYAGAPSVDPKGPAGLADGRLPGSPVGKTAGPLASPGQGRESNTRKVIRGGAWSGAAGGQARHNARAARRLWSNPSYWHPDVGFRCARDAP